MRRTFPLSTSYNTSGERIIALCPLLSGGYFVLKTITKTLFDLGNIISWPKYGNAPAAASRAVVLCDMAFGVQFSSKK